MSSVRFDRVSKGFGATPVLDALDLEIPDGEFLVVVGPSGCGKSTLLRLLAGLETPDAGEIRIGDRVVNAVEPRDRDVAMVFQSYALYPHLTVRRNLAFGLEMRREKPAEIELRVGEAARLLGLEGLLDRKPAQLSGGQRQRVAVGRAIVRHPRVFLFDEPLSNLDANLRVQMRAELGALQRRLATTTIYVTHDQVEAMTMGDRVAVLDRGRLQQCAPPQEIYDRPSTLFVARFMGSPPINLLPARVGADGRSLLVGSRRLPLPASLAGAALGEPGRTLVLGFRPEATAPAEGAPGPAAARLAVEVEFLERLGHETLVHAQLDGERVIAKAHPRSAPRPGAAIEVEIDLRAAHLFDPATSLRLDA